jgi:hypothetical protein
MRKEVAAWELDRNNRAATIDWRFTTEDARIKLKRIYPQLLMIQGTSFPWRFGTGLRPDETRTVPAHAFLEEKYLDNQGSQSKAYQDNRGG